MEEELIALMSELGYWWVEGINQHQSHLCVDLIDYTSKFAMDRENAEKILKKIQQS